MTIPEARGRAKTAVITRTKNRQILLKRAVASVLDQSDRDFVHVIINDGGEKAELESFIDAYRDDYAGRLLLIHNNSSLGMEAASNMGIRASDSRYVVIHDDDDSWDPEFLSKMTAFLERECPVRNLAGVVCYSTSVQEEIVADSVKEHSRHSIASLVRDLTLWRVCAGNCFPPISFLYKREVYEKTGGLYREDLPVQGDWEFNLRFMQHYDIGILKEHLAFYHKRIGATSVKGIYSNSISVADQHEFIVTHLRNEFLRKDLAEGRLGLGYLMNMNPLLLRLEQISCRMMDTWLKAKAPLETMRRWWCRVRGK
jgi:glycosyltransferase involved in cell wall biosynthesis